MPTCPLPPTHPALDGGLLAVCTTPSRPAVDGGRKAVCTTPVHLALDERLRAVCKLRSDCFDSNLSSVCSPSSSIARDLQSVQLTSPSIVGGPTCEFESILHRVHSDIPCFMQVNPNSTLAAVSSMLPAPSAPSTCLPASASASNLAAATGRPPGPPSACASPAPQHSLPVSALPPDARAPLCATADPRARHCESC